MNPMDNGVPSDAGSPATATRRRKTAAGSLPVQADQTWPPLPDAVRLDRRKARISNRFLAARLALATIGLSAAVGVFAGEAGAICLAICCFASLKAYERLRKTTAADDKWIVEQPNNGEYLVEMLVEVDGVVLGRDRGIVWFDDNAVYFTGQRSWFRIGADHIYPYFQGRALTRPFDEMAPGKSTFRVVYPQRRVRIKLVEAAETSKFGTSWTAFHLDKLGALTFSPVQTVLPPLTIDPDYRHDIFRDTELASPNLGKAIIAAAVTMFLLSWIPLMLFPLAGVLTYALRIQAYRFLRPARDRMILRAGQRMRSAATQEQSNSANPEAMAPDESLLPVGPTA